MDLTSPGMDDIRLWLVEITSGVTFATMVDLGYDQ